ncbi:PHD finger protein-like protein [Perilla frutescens var. hirtella]|nr:PHD finger protein-like protein [Perilla frutescens var. hirtella]
MADVFDDEVEGEPTISMKDYLEAVEEEELEADLVLGGDEGKECTYSKGYMKRQAIFSCLTCTPAENAGICTACCLSCHEGHEIVELWTKRNFRCDCGNSKFGEFFCKLLASKDAENSNNAYNHNFKGTYCTCNLPYPDPSAEEQVEMLQCCICEDWFHEEHIGLSSTDKIPRDEDGEPLFEDFICQDCAVVCSFLAHYPQNILATNVSGEESVVHENDPPLRSSEKLEKENCSITSIEGNADAETIPAIAKQGVEVKECTEVAGPSSKCIIGIDLARDSPTMDKAKPMFLYKNWRESLCVCEKCSEFYAKKGIGFITDKEDSIAEYERMAKEKRNENLQKQEGAELNFLNNLDHVAKMEILSGIADMKNEFSAFLESTDQSKPVTAADIQQVFENLAKKRKRTLYQTPLATLV